MISPDPPPPPSRPPWLRAWVVFFLVSWLGGLVAGAIATGPLHFILGLAGIDEVTRGRAASALGFLVALPVSFGAYCWSVRRYFPPPPPASGSPDRGNPHRTVP